MTTRIPSSITLEPIHELFDSLDRNHATKAAERNYRHQPTVAKLPDGTLIAAMRAGSGHSDAPDWTSFVRSFDNGVTWEDRRGEVLFDPELTGGMTHVAALSYAGDKLWLVGCDVQQVQPVTYPARVSWIRSSPADVWPPQWGTKVALPVLGTMHTTFGITGVFEDPFDAETLYVAGYYRDFIVGTSPPQQEKRYTAVLLKGADYGTTWTVQGTIARDTSPTQGRQFEEPLALFVGDVDGHMRAYVRDDIGGEGGVNAETIWTCESWDHGQTWSEPTIAFAGRGTTSVIRTHSGVYVACTRSSGSVPANQPIIGMRGVLNMSDDGVTWRPWTTVESPTVELPHGEFQMPRTAQGGLFDGGAYMAGMLIELEPDHIGILSAQETIATDPYSRSGLYWREGIVTPSQPVADVRWRSEAALEFPATGANYLTFGRHALLDGAGAWTIQFRHRFPASGTAVWSTQSRTIIASASGSPTQRQLAICSTASRCFEIWVATSLTTWAIFRTPQDHASCINNSWLTVTVRFLNGVLRVWLDDVEVTLEQTYGGALPTAMVTPTSSNCVWQVGANANSNTLRQTQLDDIVIWPAAIDPVDVATLRKLGDKSESALGAPTVWLRCENNEFMDSMSTWSAPAITGTLLLRRRSLCARSAEQ